MKKTSQYTLEIRTINISSVHIILFAQLLTIPTKSVLKSFSKEKKFNPERTEINCPLKLQLLQNITSIISGLQAIELS